METLSAMETIFTGREAAVAKEITKLYEEVFRGGLSDILHQMGGSVIAGEYVVIVEGKKEGPKASFAEALPEVFYLMKKGFGRKDAVKKISETYGLSKKELYDKSLAEEIA